MQKEKETISLRRFTLERKGKIMEKRYIHILSKNKASIVTMEELPRFGFGC